MAIKYAQTPKDQFRDLIPTFRNRHIVALMQPLVLLHQQIHSNGGLADRSGSDTSFRNLVLRHVFVADGIRARITFNQENDQLSALTIPQVSAALMTELQKSQKLDALDQGNAPFGGDTVVATTQQLIDVPWLFDGTDDSGMIRLQSELESRFKSGPGYLLFHAVNEAIVAVTQTESRFRSQFISMFDSTRILGHFQQIVTFAMVFMGEDRRLDVPESVLSSERPSGAGSQPNLIGEVSGNVAAAAK